MKQTQPVTHVPRIESDEAEDVCISSDPALCTYLSCFSPPLLTSSSNIFVASEQSEVQVEKHAKCQE